MVFETECGVFCKTVKHPECGHIVHKHDRDREKWNGSSDPAGEELQQPSYLFLAGMHYSETTFLCQWDCNSYGSSIRFRVNTALTCFCSTSSFFFVSLWVLPTTTVHCRIGLIYFSTNGGGGGSKCCSHTWTWQLPRKKKQTHRHTAAEYVTRAGMF